MPKRKKTKEYNQALKEYKQLAKEADRRLRKLERLSKKEGFTNVKEWSYKRAMRDIKEWTGTKRSFKAAIPKGDEKLSTLRSKINDVKRFLDAPTSQEETIRQMYQKRADDLNKNFGTNFSWEDLGNVFEKKEENTFYKKFKGKTYLKAVSFLKDNEEEIMRNLFDISTNDPQAIRSTLHVGSGNAKVKEAVLSILDEYGIQFTELY